MRTIHHKAEERGHADHGWLNAHHTFSFASWHNPNQMNFGMLRVLNDDVVEGGKGFGRHPHDNMEIVTIPLEGALEHKDSIGSVGIIRKDEIQIMSAGTGVYHSEVNASKSEPAKILQTWVFPKTKNIEPRYDQKTFPRQNRINKILNIVSPDRESKETMWINQDCWYSLGSFEVEKDIEYKMHREGNGVYIFVIEGKIKVDGIDVSKRDGIGVWDVNEFPIDVIPGTELLLIEVPMK
ncbi:MAG: pirin family protein [Bacteroidetes bacterium]|nr:pirin family protein [Bacteroidota bacterium]